jgi:GT2 family glycosyltransferase
MLAIVVVYRQVPAETQALRSLIEILTANLSLTKNFALIVYDNSPDVHSFAVSAPFLVEYRHDPSNTGLAAAYNYALSRAEEMSHDWLLLLDQDTVPTYDFLTELVTCISQMDSWHEVASIVPKLLVGGEVDSPAADYIDQLRHQFTRSRHTVPHDVAGVQRGRLSAYNSGATLRVAALRAIGGFPKEFWLDYLDHAVFHSLLERGYRMYIMRAMLKHDLGHANLSSVPTWRLRNILAAQTLFVVRAGNLFDLLLYRIWLLRYARRLFLSHKDRRIWKEAALQVILLKISHQVGPR